MRCIRKHCESEAKFIVTRLDDVQHKFCFIHAIELCRFYEMDEAINFKLEKIRKIENKS